MPIMVSFEDSVCNDTAFIVYYLPLKPVIGSLERDC